MIFCIFYQVNNQFLHQSYLKSPVPSQINLIKNAKNQFLSVKKLKNTSSAQLCNRHLTLVIFLHAFITLLAITAQYFANGIHFKRSTTSSTTPATAPTSILTATATASITTDAAGVQL